MNTQTAMATTTTEAEIRALLDSWLDAVRASDLDAIMSHYAPDVLAFDAIAQLQFRGAEAYAKHWEACLSMCSDMLYEIHELGVEADGGVAFCRYLARCGGTGPDGEEKTGWMRATVCCRRTDGGWRIAHEHYSAPFDPESGKALFDLVP